VAERTELLASIPPVERSWSGIDAWRHRKDIALSAYYRSEARGFAPGGEVGDWLEAEREIAVQGGDE
jgi:hypothetical protein